VASGQIAARQKLAQTICCREESTSHNQRKRAAELARNTIHAWWIKK